MTTKSDKIRKGKFPYATTKSIMQHALEDNGQVHRVSQFSIDEVNAIVSDVAGRIAVEACVFAKHREKKVLQREDIVIAAKVLGFLE